MSHLATIQRNLSETTALLRSYETALAEHPASADWAQHDIRSLTKLERQLRSEFTSAANSFGADECRYRLFRDGDEPTLAPVTTILGEFQTLVALVFHAMERKAPLVRTSLDAMTVSSTSFEIGYSFEGSVGFVLLLPNARLVAPDMQTLVDEAIETVFRLPQLMSPSAVKEIADRYGRPIVRSCYRWAEAHAQNRIGSDAEWRRGTQSRGRMFVQYQELEHLNEIIDSTSDETFEEFAVDGILTAVNATSKTFQFSIENADEIRGTFKDAISMEHAAEVPKRYKAQIRRKSSINFALDEVRRSHELLALE